MIQAALVCSVYDGDGRITDFEEKPIDAETSTVSTGVYMCAPSIC